MPRRVVSAGAATWGILALFRSEVEAPGGVGSLSGFRGGLAEVALRKELPGQRGIGFRSGLPKDRLLVELP